MKLAMNPATTMDHAFEADVVAYHAAGITHMEFWFDKLDRYMENHDLDEVRDFLSRHDMTMVGALPLVQIMLEDVTSDEDRLAAYRRQLGLCRDLEAPVLIFIPESPEQADRDVYPTMERNLRRACAVAADYNVKLALECLQGNCLVSTLATAKRIVRNVDHPNLGLLIDLAHFWMGRSDLSDLADLEDDEILLVHVDDMTEVEPEFMTDHDRTFPGQGRGIERQILPAIQATGYDGYFSLELFNRSIWGQPIERTVAQTTTAFEYLEGAYGRSGR